ncbi:MAG: OmpA family protein [Pseudomonadota bacterium]
MFRTLCERNHQSSTHLLANARRWTAALLLPLLVVGCTTNPYTGERQATKTAKGAGIGAAIGAVVGALTGDDADERRKRALIGAGVGALAGSAVGAYMDAQEARLREQLQGTGVSVTRMGNDVVLNMPGNITFDVNESNLRGNFIPVLDSVTLVLQEYNQTLIDVTGHTDSTGGMDYNMALSERRANSVADYLRGVGVDGSRVYTLGVGPNYPVADNTTSVGRQLNRRVELVLKPLTQS